MTADDRDVLEEGTTVVTMLSQDMSAFAAARVPEEQKGRRPQAA